MLARHGHRQVPVMMGSTTDEANLFIFPEVLKHNFSDLEYKVPSALVCGCKAHILGTLTVLPCYWSPPLAPSHPAPRPSSETSLNWGDGVHGTPVGRGDHHCVGPLGQQGCVVDVGVACRCSALHVPCAVDRCAIAAVAAVVAVKTKDTRRELAPIDPQQHRQGGGGGSGRRVHVEVQAVLVVGARVIDQPP
eukprot:gene11613-biopygen8194